MGGAIFNLDKQFLSGLALASVLALTGCEDGGGFNLAEAFKTDATRASATEEGAPAAEAETVTRIVEAPDVFEANESGLWDGRPSLGGTWVAHPDVTAPERVRIVNADNGRTIEGALFKRERELPGPRIQVSSDAAAALGMLAGSPTTLEVVALREETVVIEPEVPVTLEEPAQLEQATLDPAPTEETASDPAPEVAGVAAASTAAGAITETTLDPIEAADAAIDAAAPTPAESTEVETAATSAVAAETPAAANPLLRRPYVQVGIFNVEANANLAADQLRTMGIVPSILPGTRDDGEAFWRVVVGPASTLQERREVLRDIREQGFPDAYPVTN